MNDPKNEGKIKHFHVSCGASCGSIYIYIYSVCVYDLVISVLTTYIYE
jgi:hypothetical protein